MISARSFVAACLVVALGTAAMLGLFFAFMLAPLAVIVVSLAGYALVAARRVPRGSRS